MADEVILLTCWASPYAIRVKIALEEKDIEYESREEDLGNKTALLLKSNPVHKKVPVLIHNGKPICESLVQVQYIDEVWKKSPLLPSDPYQRAQAIFWANFIDSKVYETGKKIWALKGEELETAKKEFIESLKVLEAEIGDKKTYFSGDTFGYVDVALVPLYSWLFVIETCANFTMEEECPKVLEWLKRCLQRESVFKSLPDQQKIFGFMLQLKKILGIE